MPQVRLQEQQFLTRVGSTRPWDRKMVSFLKRIGHIQDFREATDEEDRNEFTDFWFKYPNQEEFVRIAFKQRMEPKKRDIPVCYRQPFWGVDSERTVVGRDFKCLTDHDVQQYYVAVKNADFEFCEIYRTSKGILLPIVQRLADSWREGADPGALVPYSKLTARKNSRFLREAGSHKKTEPLWRTEDGEVWWHKNPDHVEKYPKINFYVPERFKEESLLIPTNVYNQMSEQINQEA